MRKNVFRKLMAIAVATATFVVSSTCLFAGVSNAQTMPSILLPNGDHWTKYGVNIKEPDTPIVSPFAISFVGDSTTRGDQNGFSYADVVCEDMGAVKLPYYKGEDTMADLDDFGMFERYKQIHPASTVIVVNGGVYDYHFNVRLGSADNNIETEFGGSLNVLCTNLKKKYPNAYIVFMTPYQSALKEFEGCRNNDNGDTLEDYVTMIQTVCAKYGIPVIDVYHNSGITYKNYEKYTTEDNFHLNAEGHRIVAAMLEEFLNYYVWKPVK